MTRRVIGLTIIVALGAGTWVAARAVGRGVPVGDVPTFEVDEVPFTRTVSAEGVLKPVRTTLLTAPAGGRDALMIAWIAQDGDPVKKGDVVIRFDSTEISKRLADGESERAEADSQIARERATTAAQLRDRDRSAAITREELTRSRQLGKKDPRFFPRAEVIESEIDESLFVRRLDHAKTARTIEEQLAESRLELLAIERRKADYSNQLARKTLRALELRAPHDGTFVLQRSGRGDSNRGVRPALGPGDRAFPGMRLAEISTNHRMDAEVFVLEADAGGLAVGKAATVVLEARPDVVWRGKVKSVDAFPKPRQFGVPAQYFATVLEIQGDTAGLKPGQRLHATITLEDRPRAMVVPRQAVFRRDNDSVVYRRRGDRFEAVKVQLGPGTVGRLVIASGVARGDEIALRDPALSADQAVSRGAENAGGAAFPTAPAQAAR